MRAPRPIPAPVSRPSHSAAIRAGADPNRWRGTWPYDTALCWATKHGKLAWVKVLLGVGVDPNREDVAHRWPPLLVPGVEGMLLLLLAAGANPHHKDKAGNTPLAYVRIYGTAKRHELLQAAVDRVATRTLARLRRAPYLARPGGPVPKPAESLFLG